MTTNFYDYLSRFHIYSPFLDFFSSQHPKGTAPLSASLPRVCFYSVLLLEEHSWTLTAEVFENMTTYVVRSLHPTVSTLSSKADDNQTQWYSTRTFPSPTSNHIFSTYRHKKSQPSNRRRAFGNAGQKYDSDTAGNSRRPRCRGAPGWGRIFLDAAEELAFFKTFFWDSTQHNLLLSFLLVKQPGKKKNIFTFSRVVSDNAWNQVSADIQELCHVIRTS